MQIDPADLSARDMYAWMVQLITPRPIAWVSTLSVDGIANLAPFSFFNGAGANPPTVVFCPANRRDGTPKDTLANIQRTGQFVVNVVTDPLVDAVNASSAEFDPDVDEFEMTNTERAESVLVDPPRVAASAAAFECRLYQSIQLGIGPGGANVVIGTILRIHIDDGVIGEDGKFREERMSSVGRMGGANYVRTTDRFEIARPPRPRS